MAEIKPFKGLLYNKNKIGGDYSSVVAPPYDVISENMRDELYGKHDYNVIRLILGKPLEGDDQKNNKYTRARELLDRWQREEVLVRDDSESFYIYLQEYDYKGKRHRRAGFMGLMKIGDPGSDPVLPHEYTHAKPKEDRMNLIKQVESNLSPIFTLYEDENGTLKEILEKAVSSSNPVIDTEVDGERCKLWRLSDEGSVKKIVSGMAGKKVFIADGHHRYEVARAYRDMRKRENGYNGSADHVMMYFTDLLERDSLTVMATHRVIKVMPAADEDEVAAKLGKYFDIAECDGLSALMERLEGSIAEGNTFGFFGGNRYFFMSPRDRSGLLKLVTEKKPAEWKELDVSVLHSAVFDGILSISNAEGNITYVKDPEDAESLVRDGSHTGAFFLNPTRVEQLKAVAELGEMMPQKSTYFYPKLLTGIVINRFEKVKVKAEG